MRLWSIAVSVLLLLTPALAWAQEDGDGEGDAHDEGASPEDPQAAQRARERFQAGMEHFEAHRYRDAIHEFELAASLVPSADIWFNIARAWEELREFEPAIEYYQRYLRDRVDPPIAARSSSTSPTSKNVQRPRGSRDSVRPPPAPFASAPTSRAPR